MTIKVLNGMSGDASLWVAINRWGQDGSTGNFQVRQGMTETWSRSDSRGFIMVVSIGADERTARSTSYFVQADSDIIVTEKTVTDHKSEIPAHERPRAGAGKHLSVQNDTTRPIHVAFSHWAADGATHSFTIQPKITESWDRGDKRGAVMVIERLGSTQQYFVAPGDEVVVKDGGVWRNNARVEPLVK